MAQIGIKTEWKCDICGAVAFSEGEDSPTRWEHVRLPKKQEVQIHGKKAFQLTTLGYDVCRSCLDKIMDFLWGEDVSSEVE